MKKLIQGKSSSRSLDFDVLIDINKPNVHWFALDRRLSRNPLVVHSHNLLRTIVSSPHDFRDRSLQ
jgi:hypothetical protein